jgi:hypothetical protein
MKCKPCRVTYQGTRYQVNLDGSVFPIDRTAEAYSVVPAFGPQAGAHLAKLVRREASRQRRNRNSRERHQTMTDLGMKRTPYGYE